MLEEPVDLEGNQIARPLLDADLELEGPGETLLEFLATANGFVKAEESAGLVDTDPLRNVLELIHPASAEEEHIDLTCYVIHAEVNDGLAVITTAAIQTDLLEIMADGSINMATAELDLRFRVGKYKGSSVNLARIVSPLVQVSGTIDEPIVELEPGNVAAALLTDGWSILISAFKQLSRADENICEASLRRSAGNP